MICYILRHFKKACGRQVVLDDWFPLTRGSFSRPTMRVAAHWFWMVLTSWASVNMSMLLALPRILMHSSTGGDTLPTREPRVWDSERLTPARSLFFKGWTS